MTNLQVNSPMDLLIVYLNANMGVGQRLSVNTIHNRLACLPLFPVLGTLAQITYRADKIKNKNDSIELAKVVFRPSHLKNALDRLKSSGRATVYSVASQIVCGLAVHALAYCEYDTPDGPLDIQELVFELGDLILALGALLDGGGLGRDGVLMELLRMDLWARIHDYDRWYELAFRLATEILPNMQSNENWIDLNRLVSDVTGIKLDTFLALTNAMAIVADNSTDGYKFPHYTDTPFLDNTLVDKWTEFWTTSIDDARELAKQDVLDTRLWSFGAFYERPILKLGDTGRILMRPWFLAQKSTPVGYFSTIDTILRRASPDEPTQNSQYNKWSRLYGDATELLGRKLIDEYASSLSRIDEDDIIAKWGTGKTCDTVFLGDDWLALDFVFRRIKKATATTGSVRDLAEDLNKGVVEKLLQIDDTLSRGFRVIGEPKGAIYPVVVIGAPFAFNGLMLTEIDAAVAAGSMQVIGHHAKCKPPVTMDLEEFWLLLETATHNKMQPAQLLEQWLSSSLNVSSFRSWLVTKGPPQAPPSAPRGYGAHVKKQLFGRTR